MVTSDPARAAAGLQAAAERLFRVGDDGVEFPDDDAMYAAGDSVYTPNFVSEVETRSDGACLWIDTKGGTDAAMAQTMLRIVTAELGRAGVTEAQVRLMTSVYSG